MWWIALLPPPETLPGAGQRDGLAWWALQFTPRVVWVDEALLLEVSGSERLWGGRARLLRRLLHKKMPLAGVKHAQAATSLIAIALLRVQQKQPGLLAASSDLPARLPLWSLSAAALHAPTLARMGCRTWGQLRALPRAGVERRFGPGLLAALDAAYGERAEAYPWLQLPEVFDLQLELPALATSAPELLWAAQRLLAQLQCWLRARQQGVLGIELEWALDLKRVNGRDLPPCQSLQLRTARPVQGMAHLRRLLVEQLARTCLAAPASRLRLRSLETRPWAGDNTSLLAQAQAQSPGSAWHELVERLSARLGDEAVLQVQLQADHRPEQMQRWAPARQVLTAPHADTSSAPPAEQAPLHPQWLLHQPLPLALRGERPWHGGMLQLLSRAQRLETGWWDEAREEGGHGAGPVARDYFVARSPSQGLLWVYCERLQSRQGEARLCWFLHGFFA